MFPASGQEAEKKGDARMKVFVTGGRGFVGTELVRHFLERGFSVVATGSREDASSALWDGYTYIAADTTKRGEWQSEVSDADIVINLAGRSIFRYWTEKHKREIYNSRVLTTRNLISALPNGKRAILLSVSAVGIYGSRGDDMLSESEPHGDDFLARVCRDWEKEVEEFDGDNIRKIVLRSGIVLGSRGGALSKMALPYKFLLGGPLGSGRQWFPWIHIKDYVRAVDFLLAKDSAKGAFNLCSPSPVQNRYFSARLAEVLKRPNLLRVPSFAIRLLLREFGETLLGSQRAFPNRLLQMGFQFRFPEIGQALLNLRQNS